jgi:hypothetical protein
MCTLPPYLRYDDVRDLLEPLGIHMKQFDKLVAAGTIQRITLGQKGRGYYLRAEIDLKILAPFREAEAKANLHPSLKPANSN